MRASVSSLLTRKIGDTIFFLSFFLSDRAHKLVHSDKQPGTVIQSIKLPPYAGQILMCDYQGFMAPEMVKKRPVIVISPRSRTGYRLVHVVPLSTTEPQHRHYYHIPVQIPAELHTLGELQANCWAKCDLVNTVSFARLQLIKMGRNLEGKRLYSHHCIDKNPLFFIRKTVARTFGSHVE